MGWLYCLLPGNCNSESASLNTGKVYINWTHQAEGLFAMKFPNS